MTLKAVCWVDWGPVGWGWGKIGVGVDSAVSVDDRRLRAQTKAEVVGVLRSENV